MIGRREFLTLLGAAAAGWPFPVSAQRGEDSPPVWRDRALSLQAEAAAGTIDQFLREIESQLGWTTQLPWSVGTLDQRRFDALRLLRQVPAVSELSFLDASGLEQLRVSRLAMDVVASKTDFSQDPKFTEAVAHKVYFGPVYLRRQSEPYLTLSLAGTRREAGVSVAEVGLKLVWDLIRQIGIAGYSVAYVLDAQNRIIGHSAMFAPALDTAGVPVDGDFSLFGRDFSRLAQVQAARATGSRLGVVQAHDIDGREVSAVAAPIDAPGWLALVECPN
jgi:hypothetical protein